LTMRTIFATSFKHLLEWLTIRAIY